jgi:outer membrane receptor for ferrienterochelin and colicins
MNRPLVWSVGHCWLASLLVCLCPVLAAGQAKPGQDLAALSLEELMAVEVSTASKFPQAVKEAPASITIVTAEEIRRFGYRTVADALRGVRGFYNTYDRNYSYIGMRGFARPGDYNTRMLLLIDGHRVNDGVYDMAPLGTDFLFDIALVERIEIIRGPGSSLYGTNALFGVINVITKSGAARKGVQVDALAGSLSTYKALASYGHVTGNGREMLIAGSTYGSHGQDRIAVPEFDDGDSPAVAVGLDDDRASSVFGSLSAGRFSVRAGLTLRAKQIPTASFGMAFGDDRAESSDDRAFVSGVYDGPIGGGWLGTARVAYDYYDYKGVYPTPGDDGVTLFTDYSQANSFTGELTARRRIGRRQLFTAGAEIRRDVQNRMWATDGDDPYLDVDAPGTKTGIYLQDEIRAASWLLLNAGIRLDRFTDFGTRATPRAAVVLLPRQQTAVKLLHGRAFRAPNPYERYYYTSESFRGLELQPEEIRSTEIVWEESLTSHLRVMASAFAYDVEQIIEQRASFSDDIFFENAGRTRGRGFEAEAETRLDNGIVGRISHTFSRVRDRDSGESVSNSPRNLTTVAIQAPVSRLMFAFEGQFVGERLNLDGSTLPGFFAPNITVSSRNSGRIGFGLSVYNALNRTYADPGAVEHRQASIQQDGRTVHVRVNVRF